MKKKRMREYFPRESILKFKRRMKLLTLLLLVTIVTHAANSYSQQTKFNMELNSVTVREVFSKIEKNSEFILLYNEKSLDVNRRVDVLVKDEIVESVLDQIFEGTQNTWKIYDRQIVILAANETSQPTSSTAKVYQPQKREISGVIKDSQGQPLPGVNVVVTGTTVGVITDINGTYKISVPEDAKSLSFSFIGMISQEIAILGQTSINITMEEETFGIDEVVAVGYGTQKRRDIIGSVSSLSSDDIRKTAPVTIESTLQGMAAGVQVNSGAGIPGAPQQIKVRGIGSISSGTDPLWIVDGIPVVSGTLDNSYNGETSQSILAMINPNDIETIQVLKDAAATSIYGSRGSNGVILVTTKTGKKGLTKVDIDFKTGISNWAKTDIGYANNTEYISIMDIAFNNRDAGPYSIENTIKQLDGATETMTREEALATNTNWSDVISQTGTFYEGNLSVSQGSEKGNSYLSFRYRNDEGNLKFNNLETYSANINLNYTLLKDFDLGYRMYASYTENDRLKSGDGKAGEGGWAQVNSNSLPWMKVYDPTGLNGYWNSRAAVNALAGIDPINAQSNLRTMNVLAGLNGTWRTPVKGLSLRGELGLNYVSNRGRSWRSGALSVNGAVAQESKNEVNTANYNAYFNYDVPINETHVLNVVTGIENTRQSAHFMDMKGEGLVGIYPEVGTPNVLSGRTAFGGESYLRGYFGRANYKLLNKYLAGVSIRRDGISKFSPENRWATFVSGSLGWIISDEEFFQFEPVSLLKLRGSFGQTGNTNIPGGITSDLWGINSGSSTLEGNNNTYLQSIGNSDIKWETTNSLDVGIDYGFLENRINGSLAFYQRKVSDMLLAVSLPPSAGIFGGNSTWQNIGDMKNEGIEFNINAVAIRKKDFSWNIGFNIAANSNKVLSLDPESDANNVGILQSGEGGIVRTITKTGLAWGTYYMAEYAGVDVQKGIPLIYEVETIEDGTTRHTGNIIPATDENMSDNKMMLQGKSAVPKILGGLNMNFTYKNFDIGIVSSFVTGNYIYNRLLQSSMTPNAGMLVANKKLLTESWTKPGDNAYWPQVTAGVLYNYDNEGNPTTSGISYGSDNNTPSSQYLEKGDYFKLRNLTLGYTVPTNLTTKWGINNVRLYLSANNLLTITDFSGYNPEIEIDQASGGSYSSFASMPSSRIFMFGLNVNF